MVSALRVALPLLAVLYGIDCLIVLRRGHCLFASWLGTEIRLRQGGLALAGVLPLDQAFEVSRCGVLASAEQLFLPPEDATGAAPYREDAWTTLEYEEAGGVSADGKTVRFAGGRRLRCATGAEARDVAEMVRELLALPPGDRDAAAARWSERALDPARAAARLAAFDTATSPVTALGLALFCALFLALPPPVLLGFPPPSFTATLLAGAVVLWAGTAAAAAWAARRLRHAGVIGGDGALLAISLSLPSAVRASLHLGHDLLHGCDFLAAAAVLLPRRDVMPMLRAELHGAACAASGGGSAAWRQLWAGRRGRLGSLLRHLELEESEVLAPPPRRHAAAAGYCPFCREEVSQGPGSAPCGGCGMPPLLYRTES